jgi:AraC family transcriptional regulator, regulatory protein of adaptative response / methylated-DNA-[protein]-cysteine methyltransferase
MTNPANDHMAERIARLLDCDGKAPSLEELSAATGLSPFQVQRHFSRATGLSPAAFARALREERAVRALADGGRITDAIYDAGYESAARFYAAMRERLGMTPSAWRKGGAGVRIGYAIECTSLGPMLLAATDKGVCRLSFHEKAEDLRRRFPAAELVEGAVPTELVALVVRAVEGEGGEGEVPLDTAGTPFQQRVWAQLRAIPRGETRSYAEIAALVGQPTASRAVGGANGANPVAVLVPCHRVIAADGKLGGYAWGEAIKRELLRREGA